MLTGISRGKISFIQAVLAAGSEPCGAGAAQVVNGRERWDQCSPTTAPRSRAGGRHPGQAVSLQPGMWEEASSSAIPRWRTEGLEWEGTPQEQTHIYLYMCTRMYVPVRHCLHGGQKSPPVRGVNAAKQPHVNPRPDTNALFVCPNAP